MSLPAVPASLEGSLQLNGSAESAISELSSVFLARTASREISKTISLNTSIPEYKPIFPYIVSVRLVDVARSLCISSSRPRHFLQASLYALIRFCKILSMLPQLARPAIELDTAVSLGSSNMMKPPTYISSSIQQLSTEVLEAIFDLSGNVNVARTCRRFYKIFHNEYFLLRFCTRTFSYTGEKSPLWSNSEWGALQTQILKQRWFIFEFSSILETAILNHQKLFIEAWTQPWMLGAKSIN